MRITGGLLKGRITDTPHGNLNIRPAMDRMRKCVFDIIGNDLPGKSFLDLFSGSGTIALEAASRGATDVVLCEMDKKKAPTILKNVALAQTIGLKIQCHFIATELFIKRSKRSFDYIFFDPPFPYRFHLELLQMTSQKGLLVPTGTILIHHPKEHPLPDTIEDLQKTDTRLFGRSILDFYRHSLSRAGATSLP